MRCAVKVVGMRLGPIACAEGLVCVESFWMTADGDVIPGKAQRREVEGCVCVVQVEVGGAIYVWRVLVLRILEAASQVQGGARATSSIRRRRVQRENGVKKVRQRGIATRSAREWKCSRNKKCF